MKFLRLALLLSAILLITEYRPASASECEVCEKFLSTFIDSLSSKVKSNPSLIEKDFKKSCKVAKGKDARFCWYVGGAEDSATGILGEMSKPVSWGMPAVKVCQKLKKKDSQICDLKYEQQIDLSAVDLKKLRVKQLKKILADWDEHCSDCLEKGDFINYINKVKGKYVKTEL